MLTPLQLRNNKVLQEVAGFLNGNPCAIDENMVKSLCEETGVGIETAYASLLAACCGASEEELRDYYSGMVRLCKVQDYQDDPYFRDVHFPEISKGEWAFVREGCKPFEAFPCGDIITMPDGREIPRIGFFEQAFEYPAVCQNGREWMALKPNEIETMKAPLAQVDGKVAVFGLGMGYFAYLAMKKPEVESVTVIERDPTVIGLFEEYLLPQFPPGLRIVQADAFEYLEGPMLQERFDTAFVDLWHDASDGAPMYVRFRCEEKKMPRTRFCYWIEDSLKSSLRWTLNKHI